LSSLRLTTRTVAATVAVATLLAGTAGGAVARRPTPAGMALARAALLRRADLGRGWTSTPAAKTVPGLTCAAFSPAFAGVVQTGAAMSPTFAQSQVGPFLSQTAYAYASGSEEQVVWREIAQPRLLICIAASLTRSASGGVHFSVTSKRMLALPSLSVPAVGYRVTGTASVPNQTVNVYLDVLLLGGGKTVTELSVSSFAQPVARAFELRLTRLVARRIATG
jgi:hypothetical protein